MVQWHLNVTMNLVTGSAYKLNLGTAMIDSSIKNISYKFELKSVNTSESFKGRPGH